MNIPCETGATGLGDRSAPYRAEPLLLTVVICTYNRSDLLASCLRSLACQTAAAGSFEVLVVDNNSTDATADTAVGLGGLFQHFRLVVEPAQGLSYARNRGWREARGSYVAYLDDDAEAYPDWISSIQDFISRHPEVGSFGGPYDPLTLVPVPRWFPPEYGAFDLGSEERQVRLGQEWLIGCNLIFKKDIFTALGGFEVTLGMRGDTVAYGEEINLLLRIHEQGIPIYYVPSVRIRHLVRAEKLRLRYLLAACYQVGRDHELTFKVRRTLPEIAISLAASLVRAFLRVLKPNGVPLKRKLYYALRPTFGEVGALVEYCVGRRTSPDNGKPTCSKA